MSIIIFFIIIFIGLAVYGTSASQVFTMEEETRRLKHSILVHPYTFTEPTTETVYSSTNRPFLLLSPIKGPPQINRHILS